MDFRFYCGSAAIQKQIVSTVTIGLRCFAVDGHAYKELPQVQISRTTQPLVASHSSLYSEWRDVLVPCRSVLEVLFTFGQSQDSHLVYVGQVSRLFAMANAESELIRCLARVQHDDWFQGCSSQKSSLGFPTDFRIIVPQQFDPSRFSKILLFDLQEEQWNTAKCHNQRFQRQVTSRGSEFCGQLFAGSYRLYLWDDSHQRWIMDSCTVHVREPLLSDRDALFVFGHHQATENEASKPLVSSCMSCFNLFLFCVV
jgi:hypothetical protein